MPSEARKDKRTVTNPITRPKNACDVDYLGDPGTVCTSTDTKRYEAGRRLCKKHAFEYGWIEKKEPSQ